MSNLSRESEAAYQASLCLLRARVYLKRAEFEKGASEDEKARLSVASDLAHQIISLLAGMDTRV